MIKLPEADAKRNSPIYQILNFLINHKSTASFMRLAYTQGDNIEELVANINKNRFVLGTTTTFIITYEDGLPKPFKYFSYSTKSIQKFLLEYCLLRGLEVQINYSEMYNIRIQIWDKDNPEKVGEGIVEDNDNLVVGIGFAFLELHGVKPQIEHGGFKSSLRG